MPQDELTQCTLAFSARRRKQLSSKRAGIPNMSLSPLYVDYSLHGCVPCLGLCGYGVVRWNTGNSVTRDKKQWGRNDNEALKKHVEGTA